MESAKDRLSTLPIEILRFITALLDMSDLKNLRTMNTVLNAVARETLFQDITIAMSPKSIFMLLEVASTRY